jgi:hypothetical protein
MLVIPNAVVFSLRCASVWSGGSYDETSGTERVPIYGVWKASQGYPVYEDPFRDPYSPSMYNFLFYQSYGAVARALRWSGRSLVTGSRLLTSVFAAIGALLCGAMIARLLGVRRRGSLWVYASMLAVWFSSAGLAWYYLTVRPDVLSVVFAVAGLYQCLRGTTWPSLLAISTIFFLAWACKQSTLGIFGAVCVYTLWREARFRGARHAIAALACLCLPFAVLVGASILFGGQMYRLNTIVVPSISRLTNLATVHIQVAHLFGGIPVVLAVPLLWIWLYRERIGTELGAENSPAVLLWVAAGVAWALGLLAVARDGGDKHSLLEAYVATSILACYLTPSVMARISSHKLSASIAAVAFGGSLMFPIAQVLGGSRLGTLSVSSPERWSEGSAIEAELQRVGKPLFAEDYLFGEPWFATDGRYPDVVIDGYLYHQVRAAGRIHVGIEALIARRRFASLLLTGGLQLERTALAAGYVHAPLPPHPHWDLDLYILPAAHQ